MISPGVIYTPVPVSAIAGITGWVAWRGCEPLGRNDDVGMLAFTMYFSGFSTKTPKNTKKLKKPDCCEPAFSFSRQFARKPMFRVKKPSRLLTFCIESSKNTRGKLSSLPHVSMTCRFHDGYSGEVLQYDSGVLRVGTPL
jgi:hypothetical protein